MSMDREAALATARELHQTWLARTEAGSTRTKAYAEAIARYQGQVDSGAVKGSPRIL